MFVSHPADVNGDHWVYYCFLQVALRDLRGRILKPDIYVYFVHAPGWPLPRNLHKSLLLQPYDKHFLDSLIKWSSYYLNQDEIERKNRLSPRNNQRAFIPMCS